MPEILDRCVRDVMDKGHDESSAWAICRTALQMSVAAGEPEEMALKRAGAMCDEIKDKKFSLETFDLPGQEIFASGEWNGDKYTEQDLENMAQAFRETSQTWGVPIKLSHDHPSHLPAVGWVENVRRVGSKLFADFKRIPKKIYELILAGGYRGKSAEIFWNAKVNDKLYPYLLKAVAILGVDPKAVQKIDDLVSLYGAEGGHSVKAYEGAGELKSYDLGSQLKEEGIMEELKAKLAEAEKNYAEANLKVKELEGKVTTVEGAGKAALDAMTKRCEEAEGKLAAYAEKQRHDEVVATVNGLVEKGNIAPAKKDYAVALLLGLKVTSEKKYKLADKEYSLSEIAVELLSSGGVDLNTEEVTERGEKEFSDLDAKVKDYMAKNPDVSYKDALRTVAPTGK